MIYLDNNATTFLAPEVFAAIEPILKGRFGNPSSIHQCGQAARALLVKATREVATHFDVHPSEVIFTSGATEALNMVMRSLPKEGHLITSSLEHISVIEAIKLSRLDASYLDPKPGFGALTTEQVKEALRPNTTAIVVMAANNETGIKTDIESIAHFAREQGLLLVVDGVAVLGKGEWRIPLGVSAVCFSGHKMHAPTGVGVALVQKPLRLQPLVGGGAQQRGMRGGTENLAGIVGFAKALTLLPHSSDEVANVRDYFEQSLRSHLPDIVIHGMGQPRVCNTSNIAFLGVDGESLLMQLDLMGVSVSHGSACASGSLESSRVLLNMQIDPKIARSSIRFSLSRYTTLEEIERAILLIIEAVKSLRF